MFKIIKRLPAAQCIAAIALLFVQIASLMYLPYVTAMIALSVCGLIGAIFDTLIFSRSLGRILLTVNGNYTDDRRTPHE